MKIFFQTTHENIYAAILIAKIFKIVIIIITAFDIKIHQFDAINAFINSKFNEKNFMNALKNFVNQINVKNCFEHYMI